jgi:hypothetical protein
MSEGGHARVFAHAGVNRGVSFASHGQSFQGVGNATNVKNEQLGFFRLLDGDVPAAEQGK